MLNNPFFATDPSGFVSDSGFWAGIGNFFSAIGNFFSGLFSSGGGSGSSINSGGGMARSSNNNAAVQKVNAAKEVSGNSVSNQNNNSNLSGIKDDDNPSSVDLTGNKKEDNGLSTVAEQTVKGAGANTAAGGAKYQQTYSSKNELQTALGSDGFTTGKRPLENMPFSIRGTENSGANQLNIEGLHEQVFYVVPGDDGKPKLQNLGFFGEGKGVMPDEGFPNNIDQYRFGPIQQGPLLTEQLKSMPGFRAQDYTLFRNNCQDYCSAVRQKFGK